MPLHDIIGTETRASLVRGRSISSTLGQVASCSWTSGRVSNGSKPIRAATSSLEGRVPSAKRLRRKSPVSLRSHQSDADRLAQVRAELRRADPGAQVVGRVEPVVHVGQVAVRPVAEPRRGAQTLRVLGRIVGRVLEVAPRAPARSRASPHSAGRAERRGNALPRRSPRPRPRRRRSAPRASPARGSPTPGGTSRSRSARGRERAGGTCTEAPGRRPRSGARARPRAGAPGSRAARPARA